MAEALARKVEVADDLHILLLIRNPALERVCLDSLRAQGLKVSLAHGLDDFNGLMASRQSLYGVVIDVQFAMKAGIELKHMLQRLENIYPFFRIKRDHEGALRGLCPLLGSATLDEFIEHCRNFPGRPLRDQQRHELHIASWLSDNCDFAPGEASVTVNLSLRGAFFYSARSWQVGDRVQARFAGFEGTREFVARVCWCRPWGAKTAGLPGVGVEFLDLSADQSALLDDLLSG